MPDRTNSRHCFAIQCGIARIISVNRFALSWERARWRQLCIGLNAHLRRRPDVLLAHEDPPVSNDLWFYGLLQYKVRWREHANKNWK